MESTTGEAPGYWASTAGCVLVVLACILLVHPVLETGFSDDYSYIYSAKRAAETGRLIYNGWATACLGIQVYLGALFIRIFGFSFTAARAVCWVLSLANVALMHRLFLRVARCNWNAIIAALTISLAPITFSTSLVFFTDLPAMFAFVATLYGCVRALQADDDASVKRWLVAAVVLSLVLGSVRQTAWGASLAMVPMVGWRLRSRAGVWRLTVLLELISLAVVGAALVWLKHAPYMVHEALFLRISLAKLQSMPFLPAILVLEMLPLMIALFSLSALPTMRRTFLIAASLVAAAVPWIAYRGNAVPAYLVDTYLGFPVSHTRILGGLVIVVAIVCATRAVAVGISAFRNDRQVPGTADLGFRELFFITVPYFIAILVLIETRLGVWPRYVMALEPIAAVWLLAIYAEVTRGARFRMPVVAVAVVSCVFGVVLAHDNLAVSELTLKLERWIQASGLPRQQIEVGMESDGWYEISNGHTIHDLRILYPAGATAQRSFTPEQRACHSVFLPMFPDIHPVYTVAAAASHCYDPAPIHTETQYFWMRPPLTRYIYRYIPSQQIP